MANLYESNDPEYLIQHALQLYESNDYESSFILLEKAVEKLEAMKSKNEKYKKLYKNAHELYQKTQESLIQRVLQSYESNSPTYLINRALQEEPRELDNGISKNEKKNYESAYILLKKAVEKLEGMKNRNEEYEKLYKKAQENLTRIGKKYGKQTVNEAFQDALYAARMRNDEGFTLTPNDKKKKILNLRKERSTKRAIERAKRDENARIPEMGKVGAITNAINAHLTNNEEANSTAVMALENRFSQVKTNVNTKEAMNSLPNALSAKMVSPVRATLRSPQVSLYGTTSPVSRIERQTAENIQAAKVAARVQESRNRMAAQKLAREELEIKVHGKVKKGGYTARRKHMRKISRKKYNISSANKQTYKQRKQRKHHKRNTRKR